MHWARRLDSRRRTSAVTSNSVEITLSEPFLTGTHLVWIKVTAGETDVAWASAGFNVHGPRIESITPEKRPYDIGETIKGTVTLNDADGGHLTVALIDTFGRQVDTVRKPASETVSFELDSTGVRSLTARIQATLDTGERVEASDFESVAIINEHPLDDYQVCIWASYFHTACARPWAQTLLEKQRELGVDFGLMAHSGSVMYHQNYAEHNMIPAPENMHRIFFKLREDYEKMNLAEPGFEEEFREVIHARKSGLHMGNARFQRRG